MMLNIPAKFHRHSLSGSQIKEGGLTQPPECYGAPQTPSSFRVKLFTHFPNNANLFVC